MSRQEEQAGLPLVPWFRAVRGSCELLPVRLFFSLSGYVLDKLCDLFVRPIEISEILKDSLNVFIIQCGHFVHTFHLPFWLLALHPEDIQPFSVAVDRLYAVSTPQRIVEKIVSPPEAAGRISCMFIPPRVLCFVCF